MIIERIRQLLLDVRMHARLCVCVCLVSEIDRWIGEWLDGRTDRQIGR